MPPRLPLKVPSASCALKSCRRSGRAIHISSPGKLISLLPQCCIILLHNSNATTLQCLYPFALTSLFLPPSVPSLVPLDHWAVCLHPFSFHTLHPFFQDVVDPLIYIGLLVCVPVARGKQNKKQPRGTTPTRSHCALLLCCLYSSPVFLSFQLLPCLFRFDYSRTSRFFPCCSEPSLNNSVPVEMKP